ncbi:MAG: hypothetical protein NTV97_02850 [Alphaproteobacteria bacterium]|nr:hypothetical protein [Alphaproteobacteria bacterium]
MTEAELRGKGFSIGGADGAGTDQLSIPMQDPDLPTGNATPGVIREWMPPFQGKAEASL